jgi:RNA polymerase sigma-54 factor
MVTVLQLNRLELKEMINQEIVNNPVLEEAAEAGEEITPEELQPLLEAEAVHEPSDHSIIEASGALDNSIDNEIERMSPEIDLQCRGDGNY